MWETRKLSSDLQPSQENVKQPEVIICYAVILTSQPTLFSVLKKKVIFYESMFGKKKYSRSKSNQTRLLFFHAVMIFGISKKIN